MSEIDYYIIFSYLAIVMAIGWGIRMFRGHKKPEDFMIAKKSMSGWVIGLSMFATYICNIVFLGVPARAFEKDWAELAYSFTTPLIVLWVLKKVIPYHLNREEVSPYFRLQEDYGNWAKIYAVTCSALCNISWMAIMLYGVSVALASMTGYPVVHIIMCVSIVAILYTFLGGFRSVVYTDVIQAFLIIIGGLICFGFLAYQCGVMNLETLISKIPAHKLHMGGTHLSIAPGTLWTFLLAGFAGRLFTFAFETENVQRYKSAKSVRELRKGLWIFSSLWIGIAVLFTFIGTLLYMYFHSLPGGVPEVIQTLGADSVLPYYIMSVLPNGIKGILAVGIIAAAMSSMDSGMSSISTLLYEDIYKRHINRYASAHKGVEVLGFLTLAIGMTAFLIAIVLTYESNLSEASYKLLAVLVGSLLGLMLLRFTVGRVRPSTAIIGVLSGTLVIIYISISYYLSPTWLPKLNIDPMMSTFLGSGMVLLVAWLREKVFLKNKPYIKLEKVKEEKQAAFVEF